MVQAIAGSRPRFTVALGWAFALVIAGVAYLAGNMSASRSGAPEATKPSNDHGHDHSGHDHAGHSDADSIEISQQARRNIGLEIGKVELKPFIRTISVPGVIVERPGRTIVQVTAPMTGIVTKIMVTEGEAVIPGQSLFEVRLIHEDLVQAQAELLRTAEELDVIALEVARLEKATAESAVSGKTLLERKYEKQKQQAVQRSQRQALILHGLNDKQIDQILSTRKLLQFLTIVAPQPPEPMEAADSFVYQAQSLKVSQGQHVAAGETLSLLADHGQLFVEGNAFERDIAEINRALGDERRVTAVLESEGEATEAVPNLQLLYIASQLDPKDRTLHFYAALPNAVVRDSTLESGKRYVSWKYRPGQRGQVLVPVETWQDRIVLPTEAIAQDGAESFVFTPNGDHFDRRAVHVEYKDPMWAVVANDGGVFPGDAIALSGAKQLLLALKNKSGGGVDPHAGHNH